MVVQFVKSCLYSTLLLLLLFLVPSIAAADDMPQTAAIEVIGSGPLVPRSANQAIPISFKNLTSVDLEILRVTEPRRFLKRYYLTDNLKGYNLNYMQQNYKSVFSDRFQLPEGKKDQFNSAQLPIPQSLSSGWYLVVLKAPGTFNNAKIRHMLLTDTGIQIRVLKNETNVYVSRLSDGTALPNMTVEVHRDGEPFTQVTDKHGWATFKEKIERNDIIIARSSEDSDYAVLPMREVPLDLSEYHIGGRKHQTYEAYMYSNRDLVKPGENLPVNILLRDQDGRAVADSSVELQVFNPRGDCVYNEELTSSNAGYYSSSIETSKDWLTGRYTAQVSMFDEDVIAGELKFQVEEFVPERMDLLLSGGKPWVAAGDVNQIAVQGRYLFGNPASGNQLDISTSITSIRKFSTGPNKAFLVGEYFSLPNPYTYQQETRKLSEKGELSLTTSSPSQKKVEYKSPVRVIVNLSLQEAGGAAVQRQLEFDSWVNQNIPGILPASDSFSYNSMAEFDIALLSADGQKLISGELDVELMYDRGPYYWVYEEGVGWRSRKQERWVSKSNQSVTVTDKEKRISLPVSWGDYRLIVKDKATGIRTVYEFYAGWYKGTKQLKSKPDHLVLDTDKASYKAGETAKVLLSAPLSGQLSLTLENADETIWRGSQLVKKGNVEVEVPVAIGGLSRHDIYLTATLTGVKASTAKRYFGVRHLLLDRSDRELGLSISLPTQIEPMTKLIIPVEATNIEAAQQKDTWVTVSIVDKGIINLSRYFPVNPHNYLFGQRRFEADIIDLFSRQYDNRPNPFARSRFGSDSNEHISNKNDELVESKTVILMSKPIRLQDGKANIELDIPDYNGEGQVVVTAFNNTQVGQLVRSNAISSKIITELSVPRFFVPGDQSTVTIDLFNNSGVMQKFDLKLLPSAGLTISKSSLPGQLELKEGEHWVQSVPVHISEQSITKTASLNLKVSNQLFAYDRSWKVPVTPIEPWVTQLKTVYLTPNDQYSVDQSLWNGLKVIKGHEGNAFISTSPVLSVTEHAQGLMRYPYGCAEQTTSKAWPFLLQHPALEALKQKAIANNGNGIDGIKDTRAVIASAIAKLRTMQKQNGGFALWSGEGTEEPWLTSYITEFLLEANNVHPDVVPKEMLNKANKRLQGYVRELYQLGALVDSQSEKAATAAYAAYLLSQQGKISYSTLQQFRFDFPTTLTDLQYAYAYTTVTGKTESTEKLLDSILNDVKSGSLRRSQHTYYDYGSKLRDTAKSVLVLNKMSQFPKLHSKAILLQGILLEKTQDLLNSRRWLSTQERGTLVQAAILSQKENQERTVEVLLNGDRHEQQGQLVVPLSDSLKIINPTESPLHVRLMAEGYLKLDSEVGNAASPLNTIKLKGLKRQMTKLGSSPSTPKAASTTQKWLQGVKEEIFGKVSKNTTFKVGDRILVTLDVSLSDESIPDALLVDRIPAGFVLENPELNQGVPVENLLPESLKEKMSKPVYVEYRNDRFVVSDTLGTFPGKYHYVYVLRAEVPGTYAVPPVFLESMYTPEKHAIYWQQPRHITIER